MERLTNHLAGMLLAIMTRLDAFAAWPSVGKTKSLDELGVAALHGHAID